MNDDLVTWLRRQIRLRLTLAPIKPLVDLQGNMPAHPAPAYLQYADDVPWHYFTRDSLIRHLVTSGVLVTSEPPEAWFGDWPMNDLTPLMAPGDPEDAIARCMAELAILDAQDEAWRIARAYPVGEGPMSWGRAEAWHEAVRVIGFAYRHRPGYLEPWRPGLLTATARLSASQGRNGENSDDGTGSVV